MSTASITRRMASIAISLSVTAMLQFVATPGPSGADATAPRLFRGASASAVEGLQPSVRGAGPAFQLEREALERVSRLDAARITLPLGSGRDVVANLRSFPLLAANAAIQSTGAAGAARTPVGLRFYRGEIEGDPGSRIVLAIGPDRVLGVVEGREGRFEYRPVGAVPGTHLVVDAAHAEAGASPFECASESLEELAIPEAIRSAPARRYASLSTTERLICRVAVDADYEFGVYMGGAGPATDYLLTTLAIMSSLYERDVNVALQVTYLNVWTTASDPYTSNSVDGRLPEFRSYWNANRGDVPRDVALLACRGIVGFSSRGVAWLNGLVIPGYSYAAAFFDGTSALSIGSVHADAWTWGHELGHLLGSSHTHSCFWQANGYLPAGALIDSCYVSGSYGDADPDRTPACFEPPGPGMIVPPDKGTVMSYCHVYGGGWPAVRMQVHPVCAERMRQLVESVPLAPTPVQPPVIWDMQQGGGNGALVVWDPSPTPGVIRYDVYRTTLPLAQNPVFLGSATGPLWWPDLWNFGMSPGTSYRVKAVTGGGESSFSGDATIPVCMPLEGVPSAGMPVPPGSLDRVKAMAVGDFNEDGVSDVALVSGQQLVGYGQGRLAILLANAYEGYGDGTFLPPTVYVPGGDLTDIEVDDFNEDGILDVAMTDATNSVLKIFLGQGSGGLGNGTFASGGSVTSAAGSRVVTSGDFNEDGIRDLAVGGDGELVVHLGLGSGGAGNGQFADPSPVPDFAGTCTALAVGDFNEDGIADLGVGESFSSEVRIALGTGSGAVGDGGFQFAPASVVFGSAPASLAVVDLNLDGRSDLVALTPAANAVAVALGQGSGGAGNGTFGAPIAYPAGTGPRGLSVADWYNDGIPDVAVATPTLRSTKLNVHDVQFLVGGVPAGAANGTFQPPVPAPAMIQPLELSVGDFNTDGLPDLVVLDENGAGGSQRVGFLAGTCNRSLAKTLTVQSPNGGETWFIGHDRTITWTRAAGVLAVDLELSRDGGTNWETLARGVTETSHTWRVVPPASSTARVRVVDPTVRSRKDLGNANFSIEWEEVGPPCNPCDPVCDPCPILPAIRLDPNPVMSDLRVRLTLAGEPRQAVDLFDVSGRRLNHRDLSSLGRGVHVVDLGEGIHPPSGVYFVRLTTPGHVLWSKVLFVRR